MRKKACPFGSKVHETLVRGTLHGELADHARSCPVCREILLIHRWMGEFRRGSAEADLREMRLPDPNALWTRAASPLPEEALVKKVLAPLRYFWISACAAVGLILLVSVSPAGGFLSSIPGLGGLASFFKAAAKEAVRPFVAAALPAAIGLLPVLLLMLMARPKAIKH